MIKKLISFIKKYNNDTKYYEFLEQNIDLFKLSPCDEPYLNITVASNFTMKVGSYD